MVCRLSGRSAVLLAAVASLALVSSSASAVGVAVHVEPAAGGPATTFVVSFTAPARTGVIGSTRLRDEVSLQTTSAVGGCLANASAHVSDVKRGQHVQVRLVPAAFKGRWCVGVFQGRLLELQSAVCPPGALCPMYVRIKTIGTFSLVVRRVLPPGSDVTPPAFAGLARAVACTPGAQRPGETTPYSLSWLPASDNATPAAAIVYDVYFSSRAGGEDFSQPTWSSPPGATRFRTPGLPSHGSAHFVVRARDAAGNEDRNAREVAGVDPCY